MKIIKLNNEARLTLKRGVDKVADCVRVTLGPSGRNAILGRKFESPLITNDGVSIARDVILEDEIEELGAQIIKEVSKLTDDGVGDGTTTATVLLQSIIEEGFKRMQSDGSLLKKTVDPLVLKREIDAACSKIVEELREAAKPIRTKAEVTKVAFVSVESQKIAEIIADLFEKVGKDGVITVEDGYFDVESEVVEGMELPVGLPSPYMANKESELVLHNPYILISNVSFERPEQITSLVEKLNAEGIKELVVIAENFSNELLSSFLVTKLQGVFTILALKAPMWVKSERLEDIAIKLGCVFVDKNKMMTVNKVETKDLGVATKIISGRDKTLIIGGNGNVKERVKELKSLLKQTEGAVDKKTLEQRIAALNGGVGIIKVGSFSEAERKYLKLKISDAVAATKAALDEGVVKGGGLALKEIAEKLPENILTQSIKVPYEQIQKNAGGRLEIPNDIVDPVKVTRTALQNACSLAGVFLTAEVAIADKYERDTKQDKKDSE